MKNKFALTILFLAVSLLTACSVRQKNDLRLMQIDSLMQSRPDSALRILQGIPMGGLATRADSAYYALLLTQARDKNFVVQKDDSLIGYAVAYYDKVGDARMQAKAHYYRGCVYRDMNRQPEAIRDFSIAAPLAEKTKGKRLLGLIYNNVGYIYNLQDFKEKADSVYQLMERIAEETKDTMLWAEALSKQGAIALTKGNNFFPIAEQKLLDAFTAADRIKRDGLKADISASLSKLYNRMDQGEKALFYAKLNLALRKDTTRAYYAFLILGEAYYKCKQYDSAIFYLNKTLASKSYGRKVDAYTCLAGIAMIQGNTALSAELERKSSVYKDSLYKFRRIVVNNEIIKAEADARIMLNKLYYKKRFNTYLHSFMLIAVIIVLIVLFLYRRYQRKTDLLQKDKQQLQKDKQQLQKDNQDLNQHYTALQTDVMQKNQEINRLQKELESHLIDEEHREQLQAELNEMVSKRNALAKESFLHSPLYEKMEAIIKDYQDKDESDKEMNDREWQEFVVQMDVQWNNNITRLCEKFQLSKEELHLLCLCLSGFTFSHLEYLLHLSRRTLYRKKKALLQRIDVEENSEFEEILQKIR